MKKIISFVVLLAMCISFTSIAWAAEIGDTSLTDGVNTYKLSNSILGTTTMTFYDDFSAEGEHTVKVYLVPMDTVVSLPEGNNLFLAQWYEPDEKARGGWKCFNTYGLIPSGVDVPFEFEIQNSDGTSGKTSDKKDAVLQIYSAATFKSIFIKGISANNQNASLTPFSDIPVGAYYMAPVSWAVGNKITSGTSASTFSPEKTCTRGEIITFLWRTFSEPENAIITMYNDIKPDDYFYQAARWAYTEKMVEPPKFEATTPCTRSMTVTYLWKAAGSPICENAVDFSDVPANADYAQAVSWAVQLGVTTGTSANTFSPDKVCTRGEIVTFLYRAFAKNN